MDTIPVTAFIHQAIDGNYIGIPYEKLDCQAFVEQVLHDCGISHNWRGSNHMWRDALSVKAKITNEMAVPPGAWLFTIKQDGGEKERGYNDAEGNASHVGIYLGLSRVIHSTKGGVQFSNISEPRWTHYGLCRFIDYSEALESHEETDKEPAPQSASSPSPSRTVKYIDVTGLSDADVASLLRMANSLKGLI